MLSPLEQFNFIGLFCLYLFGFDLSFSNIFLPAFLLFIFFCIFLNMFSRAIKLVPDFWQFSFEFVFKFVLAIIYQQTGIVGFIYFPFIITLFFFILFSNVISLVPFGIALTSHIIMIFFLSFTLSFFVFFIGFLFNGLSFFKIFVPEAPFFLLFILIPIEIFSYFIRALSLAIRLSANIMAVIL